MLFLPGLKFTKIDITKFSRWLKSLPQNKYKKLNKQNFIMRTRRFYVVLILSVQQIIYNTIILDDKTRLSPKKYTNTSSFPCPGHYIKLESPCPNPGNFLNISPIHNRAPPCSPLTSTNVPYLINAPDALRCYRRQGCNHYGTPVAVMSYCDRNLS